MKRDNKKGDMSLNYIFLIFIGTISVFIVVGLLSNWAFGTKKFMEKLQGSDDETEIDAQVIDAGGDCTDDAIKHGKLCWTKFQQGLVRSNLCYVLKGPCDINKNEVEQGLASIGLVPGTNLSVSGTNNVDNVAIYIEVESGNFKLVIG
ncbi:hypothetical protein JW968_05145 [Candidatus Woesearchaeota archaeon]|nr:hypothetical protein [Candidatus Woesearchaeota archaeon]